MGPPLGKSGGAPTFPPEEKLGGLENTWGKPYGKPWVNTQGFPPEETPEEKQGENPGYVESPPGETPGENHG